MSILFHHYKELKECTSEVERKEEARTIDSKKNRRLVQVTSTHWWTHWDVELC
jgi:hypothetical protein